MCHAVFIIFAADHPQKQSCSTLSFSERATDSLSAAATATAAAESARVSAAAPTETAAATKSM